MFVCWSSSFCGSWTFVFYLLDVSKSWSGGIWLKTMYYTVKLNLTALEESFEQLTARYLSLDSSKQWREHFLKTSSRWHIRPPDFCSNGFHRSNVCLWCTAGFLLLTALEYTSSFMCATKKSPAKNNQMCSFWGLAIIMRCASKVLQSWRSYRGAVYISFTVSLLCSLWEKKALYFTLFGRYRITDVYVFTKSRQSLFKSKLCCMIWTFCYLFFFYESTVWNKDLWSEELSFNHCEWSSPRIRSLYIKGFNCWSASVSVSKTQMIWSSCWNRNLKMTLQWNSLFCSSSYCGGAEVRVLNVIFISINVWNKTSSAVYWRSLGLFVFSCLPSIKKEKK